jgi:putative FmdB family regulatory protein
MPLYEYECDACHHRFEVIQKFSDPLVEKCPECGATVHKLMSSPAIQFKGSGWYITDYARKGQNADSGSERKKSAESNAGADKSSKSDAGSASDKSSPASSNSSSSGSASATTPASASKDS